MRIFDLSSDAVQAVGAYIRQHAGWHNADSLARAWRLPVTANLVRGVDNYTLDDPAGGFSRFHLSQLSVGNRFRLSPAYR